MAFFVDYQKNFATINYCILQYKLYNYGLRRKFLKIIKNFISERSYKVRYNSKFSSTYAINIGLPQGSVLSPLLFLIYVNYIFKLPENMSTSIFADDTTLLLKNKSFEKMITSTKNDLIKYRECTTANRLSLNLNKVIFTT